MRGRYLKGRFVHTQAGFHFSNPSLLITLLTIPYRLLRLASAVTVLTLVIAIAAIGGPAAFAQDVSNAEDDTTDAQNRADEAEDSVDAAVAARNDIELQLAASIEQVNELSAQLSIVGAGLDGIVEKLGFADVELSGIKAQIEVQAVESYMTALASPSVNVVSLASVEKALVVSTVVEGVVASGREKVDELLIKQRNLEDLQRDFLRQQGAYQALQDEVDAEIERLAELYEQADSAVADAVRSSQEAAASYLEALSAVELARAREEEQQRQEERSTTTTTTPSATTTTTSPSNTTTTTSGGGGPWVHPPAVEQWRSLVEQYFPSSRVEEALRIIDCESNGDPNAYNPYSGASGLFQFIPSTWATTAGPAGFPGASPFDPVANTGSAAYLGNRYEDLGLYFWTPWNCKRVLS